MKIYIISGKNAIAEIHSVEASHPMPSRQPEDVFTGQKFMIEKEEYLLLTHRETQYSIAAKIKSGLSQTELEKEILDAAYDSLRREGIPDEIERDFLGVDQGITYHNLINRMDVRSMKTKAKILKEMMEHAGDKRYLKNLVQKNINRIPVKKGKDLIIPSQRLITYLEERYERPVIDQKAYEFRIRFRRKEENHTVIMAVPEWFPTYQLHEIIGLLLGFDIDAYWMDDYEYIISSGMQNTMSSFLPEKEHMFISDESACTIRSQEELTDFLSRYLLVRDLERERILYDFGTAARVFQIRVEKGERIERTFCRSPRILGRIIGHKQDSSTSEKVQGLNTELELYYE
ncbi:DUF6933 domain-containing protein [Proteiniclasticum sp. C24MP]|uniref:DUF6933 domain-containing protein n=1 Tax=Proteiniclasticum sp. C24MP TaxID=3374101 RepID=UPI0037548ED9